MNATFVRSKTERKRKASKTKAKPLGPGQWLVSSNGTTKPYRKPAVPTFPKGRTGVALAKERVLHARTMRLTGLANSAMTAKMLARARAALTEGE